MSEDELYPDEIGPEHIGKVIRLEHSDGAGECGILDYYRRNNMGLHLVFRGGQSATFMPVSPKQGFRGRKEAGHPRMFLRIS